VFLVLAALIAVASAKCNGEHVHNMQQLMEKVLEKYNEGKPGEALQRLRRRSTEEYLQIKKNFKKAVDEADAVNSDPTKSHSAEYNKLSIMTDAELAALTSHYNISEVMVAERREKRSPGLTWNKRGLGKGAHPPNPALLEKVEKREATSLDWVARGAQVAVKNQGGCGSCWTFGAISPLEGNYYILTGEKKAFSEQEYLDCSVTYDGCNGGWMSYCYNYNLNTGHMATEDNAPYVGTSAASGASNCKWSSTANGFTKAKVTSYSRTKGDAGLQTALQGGIVTVAIKVTGTFGSYRSGVWDCDADDCNSGINHAVSVTGYGTENGKRYWAVRNSWGRNWGNGGYIKMTRDGNGNVANIHAVDGFMPVLTCNEGQTCTTPDWDESSHEDDDIEEDKGSDVTCGTFVHSGGRCLSIDDSGMKYLDLSGVCEREWCLTDMGYLYEKATDLCANVEAAAASSCDDAYSSCGYWARQGYCTHSYVSFMESYCAESCDLCGERVRLQGTCKTKWALNTAGNIVAEDSRCMGPKTGGAAPEEGTAIVPDDACSATFSVKAPMCWEAEDGMQLTGGEASCQNKYSRDDYCTYWANAGYCDHSYVDWMNEWCEMACGCGNVIASVSTAAAAKEQCRELGDDCGGINWVSASSQYQLVPGTTLAAGAAGDKAYALVSCDAACNTGETRCADGDCKADCGDESEKCDSSAGMRECPDGTCRHEHMAC